MRSCALCKVPARAFCESDQAALCWECDAKVRGANFLVSRHSQTLLCHACQCPTPGTASGTKLGHTVSLCDDCVNGVRAAERAEEESGDDAGADSGDGNISENDNERRGEYDDGRKR
ncbi:hypothetical protein SAY86_022881 [Trapa natans]|uniref:B box-type domain-containing protein n=1 Tax=Trapa natans TaxID=22666 RepID=A0AAN7LTN3_TRANT|nr:hypothetical protein SAY86_022881 [Trapa natans]